MYEIKADSLLLWENVHMFFLNLFKSSAVVLMKRIRTAIVQNQSRRFSIDGKETRGSCTRLHRSRPLNAAEAFAGRR